MTQLKYIDQTAGSILLYLTKGDFNFSQFSILCTKQTAFNDIQIEIGILSESHFVRLQTPEETLNEICACTTADLNSDLTVLKKDLLANVDTPVTTTVGQYQYSLDFEYCTWEKGVAILNKLRQLAEDREVEALTFEFPSDNFDLDKPVTELFVSKGPALQFDSFHTYPEEKIIVHTHSTLC